MPDVIEPPRTAVKFFAGKAFHAPRILFAVASAFPDCRRIEGEPRYSARTRRIKRRWREGDGGGKMSQSRLWAPSV